MSYPVRWLLAFLFTQSVEMGVYVHAHHLPRPLRERLAIAFSCSAITHPLLWFVLPELLFDVVPALVFGVLPRWWAIVAIGETLVVLAEAGLLRAFGVRGALGWSFFANLSSFTIGLFVYRFLPEALGSG